jgi:replication factor A1
MVDIKDSADFIKIRDIDEEGRWVNVRAKIIQLWDPKSELISQTGLIGDETGSIKFVSWKKSALPEVEEGKNYEFKNVITDLWQDRYSVKFNRNTQFTELEEDVAEPKDVKVFDINERGVCVNLRAKVVQLWDTRHESVSQVGLIGDETGTIKFTKWSSANLPDVVEGKTYGFKNILIDYWNDRYSVKLNKSSKVLPLSEDIEVGRTEIEINGAIVGVPDGSGLIERCTTCNRVLTMGVCPEHGEVEGFYDLRVKAILDDGETVQDILLNRKITEETIDISLEDAKEMDVTEKIERKLIGRYFRVKGPLVGRYILVNQIERYELDDLRLNNLRKEYDAV